MSERPFPTIEQLLATPALAAELPPYVAQRLIVRIASLLAVLSSAVGANGAAKPNHGPEPLLDAKAAALLLHVPTTWLREAARQGRIPAVRLGHYVRFRRHDLITLVEKGGTSED